MLRINFKTLMLKTLTTTALVVMVFAFSSILFSNDAFAVFDSLTAKGVEIFSGMQRIIFAVSGFGIIAVAIGGFFGNLNWKWLSAIGIGLFIISSTAAIIDYVVGQRPGNMQDVQTSLKSGR